SELEQSGERLARTGRTLEQRSEPINTLVKQQERQLQQEKQATRYRGQSMYHTSRTSRMICTLVCAS
ncbi:mobilization protein, partial [Shigella flexneri]|nr:mobilization protein [Shigella flexneri]